MICKNCGHDNFDEITNCFMCGQLMVDEGQNEMLENKTIPNKKNFKEKLLLVFAIFFVIFAGGIAITDVVLENDKKEHIVFDSPKLLMNVDETQELNLSADIKDVKYKSSDESVAVVSNEGVVTAKNEGVVYITAYTDDFQTSVEIRINAIDIE